MSLLVVDGVRPRQGGGPLVLGTPQATAAALEYPRPLLSPLTRAASRLDGLIPTIQPSADVVIAPDLGAAAEKSIFSSPYALASLAVVPLLGAGVTFGVKNLIQSHQTAQTKGASIAQAEGVAIADQAALITSSSAQSILDNFGQSGIYSLYVEDLKTGQLATTAPDRVMHSASLYKLFIANAIYRRIDAGQLSYDQPLNGSTIGNCLNLMITISDNGCGQSLGSLVGWDQVTQELQAQGFKSTDLRDAYTLTSPRDVATLYERLYSGSLLSADSTTQFMNLLKAQKVNDRLPQGLPAGTTFAHKTGDLEGYLHDAGIVFGPKTDYLVVMMGQPGSNSADFANLSQQLWQHFDQ